MGAGRDQSHLSERHGKRNEKEQNPRPMKSVGISNPPRNRLRFTSPTGAGEREDPPPHPVVASVLSLEYLSRIGWHDKSPKTLDDDALSA